MGSHAMFHFAGEGRKKICFHAFEKKIQILLTTIIVFQIKNKKVLS
jgi:hypothetical protein